MAMYWLPQLEIIGYLTERYEYVVPYSFVESVKTHYFVLDSWVDNAYDSILVGTKVLSVYFNKIFLLLFVATFGTVPHSHFVHPWLLPSILLYILALSLCPGGLQLQFPPLWIPRPCVQQYLSKYSGIG